MPLSIFFLEDVKHRKYHGTTAGPYPSTSYYPKGCELSVDSKDRGTYASGVICWTDIVRLHAVLLSTHSVGYSDKKKGVDQHSTTS